MCKLSELLIFTTESEFFMRVRISKRSNQKWFNKAPSVLPDLNFHVMFLPQFLHFQQWTKMRKRRKKTKLKPDTKGKRVVTLSFSFPLICQSVNLAAEGVPVTMLDPFLHHINHLLCLKHSLAFINLMITCYSYKKRQQGCCDTHNIAYQFNTEILHFDFLFFLYIYIHIFSMFRLNPKQLKNRNRVFFFEHRTNSLTASSFSVL